MHVDGGHRQKPIYFQRRHFQNGPLVAILKFLVSGLKLYFGFEYQLQTSAAQYLCKWVGAYWFLATSFSKWPPGSHIGFFGFLTLTLVWLWISTPNLNGTILIYMGRSLLIFSDITFKMAAWRPYWNPLVSWLTLVWLWKSTPKLSGKILIYTGKSLLIFRDLIF